MKRRNLLLGGLGALSLAGMAVAAPTLARDLEADRERARVNSTAGPLFPGFRHVRASDPDRSLVYNAHGDLVATLTDGSRTVAMVGPHRRFAEPRTTGAHVDSTTWILLAPTPWASRLGSDAAYSAWFTTALANIQPGSKNAGGEALAIAMSYVGHAQFGPIRDGGRDNQADFYDLLGIPWTWADGTKSTPHPDLRGYVDCSGFVRLVWGAAMHMLMVKDDAVPIKGSRADIPALPRYARQIATTAPSTTVFDSVDKAPTANQLSRLQPGDLVFFAQKADPKYISHCGMVMGLDSTDHIRFISSRAVVNGPSMGDNNKIAILDGTGYYATHLRKAIRL